MKKQFFGWTLEWFYRFKTGIIWNSCRTQTFDPILEYIHTEFLLSFFFFYWYETERKIIRILNVLAYWNFLCVVWINILIMFSRNGNIHHVGNRLKKGEFQILPNHLRWTLMSYIQWLVSSKCSNREEKSLFHVQKWFDVIELVEIEIPDVNGLFPIILFILWRKNTGSCTRTIPSLIEP